MMNPFDNDADSLQAGRDFYDNPPVSFPDDQNASFELQPIGIIDSDPEAKPTWRSLFTFTTRQHMPILVWALLTTIVAGLLKPVSAVLLGNIFTDLTSYGAGEKTSHDTLHDVSRWSIAFAVLGVLAWLLEGLFLSAWMAFGELQAASVRENMFAGMLEKDMEWYDLRRDGVGSLMIRIQTQVRELQLSVSQPFGFLIFETTGSLAALGTAFYYSWKLTLVIIATFPVAAVILDFISSRLSSAIEAQKRELSLASKYANTAITEIDTVKAFNGQDEEVWQYYSAIKRAAIYYLIQARSNALQLGFMKFIMVGIFVQGFWYGIVLVRQGMVTGHVLTTFYACLNALQAVEVLLPQWLVLTKGMSAGATLKSIMAQVQRGRKVVSMDGSLKPDACEGDLEMNDVTFAYPSNPNQYVLERATFFFPAGETTFVVGRSGSGKSTIGNLLLRFYDPHAGSLFLDGQALRTIDTGWLRDNITLLQQQSVLFNATLRQNILFGNKGIVQDADVEQACHAAGLDPLIMELPKGLETMVGSSHRELSGGQKQRVSLARAHLRNAPILILDEATSALDPTSRGEIMERMRKWREDKTTIIITHDVSSIRDDDYVYVIEYGVLVQEGYRAKLMEKKDGHFASFSGELPELSTESALNSPALFHEMANEDAQQYPGVFSKFFTFGTPETNHSSMMMQIQRHHRMSLGVASAQANAMRADSLWRSPVLPEVSEMPDVDRSRKHSMPFLSPDIAKISESKFERRPSIPFLPSEAVRDNRKPRKLSIPYLSPNLSGNSELRQRRPSDPFVSPTIPSPPSPNLSSPTSSRRDSSGTIAPVRQGSISSIIASATDSHASLAKAVRPWPGNLDGSSDLPHPKTSKLAKVKEDFDIPAEIQELVTEVSPEPASLRMIFGTVWPTLAWRDRFIMVIGFIAAFIVAAASPAFALIFAELAKTFYISVNQEAEARKWALCMIGIAVIDGFASYCSHYALEHSGQAWVNFLRVEALKRMLEQPKAWFDQKQHAPERISEYLDRNAEEMRNLIGRFLGTAFIVFWMLGISIVWALVVSWRLTLVSLVGVPAMYLITRVFNWTSSKWEDRCNTAAETASSIFAETFSHIRVVRALTLESHFKAAHTDATKDTYMTGLKRAIFSGLIFGLTDSMSFFISALIFYYSAVVVTRGQLSVERAIQVINLLLFGIANSTGLISMIPQMNSSKTTATHMLHLASLPHKHTYETRGTERLASPFPIEFRHLTFTYPNEKTRTLSNLNLVLPASSCTAIVGSSGSGKSTIASLLLGLYPPNIQLLREYPTLSFSGTPITDCNLPSLRSHISIVSQTPTLFPTTIVANILYGLSETSPYNNLSSAINAAIDAGIHEFITSLPDGYDTIIGDGGQGISGGQAQRIAIARALVRHPKLLILDEATSALDSESAEVIRDAISKLLHHNQQDDEFEDIRWTRNTAEMERAVVIITHNTEMMKVAARIVVLEEGRIVEEGGWDELRRREGAFVRLLGKQMGEGRRLVMSSPTRESMPKPLPVRRMVRGPTSPVVGRTRDSWVRRGSAA